MLNVDFIHWRVLDKTVHDDYLGGFTSKFSTVQVCLFYLTVNKLSRVYLKSQLFIGEIRSISISQCISLALTRLGPNITMVD